MELSLSDRPVDLIEDGFDLAIRGGNIGDGAGLMTRTIGLQRMAICGAPTYLAKHGRPERLDDLLRHTGIVYGRAGHIRAWEFPAGERKALVEATPPSRLRFDDVEAIADAAEAGHGLAWLPCWLIRDRVLSGTLTPLLRDVPSMEYVTYALWPETPHLTLRVRFALDALTAALPGTTDL